MTPRTWGNSWGESWGDSFGSPIVPVPTSCGAWGNAWGSSWGVAWGVCPTDEVPTGDGGDDELNIYSRFLKRKQWVEKRRRIREEEEMIAVMLTLMS